MKDLYSFHTSEKCLDEFYEQVKDGYIRIFRRCGLADNVFITFASGGVFTDFSHEFQAITDKGEDDIYLCREKEVAINEEIYNKVKNYEQFKGLEFEKVRAIEVGNIFKLMDKFSKPFNYSFITNTNQERPVLMGCYGIGTSRLVGAIVEVLGNEKGIIWPEEVAPYAIHLVLLPSAGEDVLSKIDIDKLSPREIDILIDDRMESAGVKFTDAELVGAPVVIICGEKFRSKRVLDVQHRRYGKAKEISVDVFPQVVDSGEILSAQFWN
jgi:prolyl-tRNA synthetase